MPTHDTYLDNGALAGLTVGNYMIAYALDGVNIQRKNSSFLVKITANNGKNITIMTKNSQLRGNSNIARMTPESFNFWNSSS